MCGDLLRLGYIDNNIQVQYNMQSLPLIILILRYITIKYADRGLVFGGEVAVLFDQLYLTAAVTLHAFFYGLIFSRHFRAEQYEVAFISICRRHEVLPSNNPFKDLIVIGGVLFAALAPSWILYFAARRYVSVRSEGNLPPAIFGRYRRNVVSFNETVFYNAISVAVSIVGIAISIFFHSLYPYYLYIFTYFVITLIIAVKAFQDPFLFRPKTRVTSENECSVFYVNRPEIIPRRENLPPSAPVHVANHNHNIIFVQPANNED